ncbi:class A beta-lactamase [Streptomyces caniscabiei]|uniref:class A beta-lactamase n=1 Tax=Streptomyces caniscabiei TaxID=2746961 RepID=UPI0029BBAF12|nr:class A beta-lactamase [Streptomyces caniscabiei]MDX2606594.1 class A beta-lactamase [Streptomyces caniscabiei]MDX2739532.1 class A beta-lactamase [Streptomyces caniscabiei]MDX2782087.1 class A beta-lactamase [Streptomyces caniscabiei]
MLGLGGLVGLGTVGALGAFGSGAAYASDGADAGLSRQLAELEREYAARLGIYAHDTATGRTVTYRADERFPICSVFKTLAAGAVLRDLDRDGEYLAKRIHYTKEYVDAAGYNPITGTAANVEAGMTVGELCSATVSHSDNGAGNLLLRELGGPSAITRFCRSLGDRTTRLDRWEPQLNTAEPWRTTDTTTPRAIGRTYARLLLGRALRDADRELLTDWLIANSTNVERFRAGLPADWTLADKTGGGTAYGVANDVGVVWPPGRPPLVLSVLSTKHDPAGPTDNPLVAWAAGLVAGALTA